MFLTAEHSIVNKHSNVFMYACCNWNVRNVRDININAFHSSISEAISVRN